MLTTKNWAFQRTAACLALAAALFWSGCMEPGPRALLDGEALLSRGKPAEAIEKLRAATELLPRNAQAWNHLGLALHQAGQRAEAAQAYQRALSLDRNLAAARFNLGSLYLEQGNFGAAATEIGTYTVLQPGSADGWDALGTAWLRAKRADDAERAYLSALKLNTNSAAAWNGLGVAQTQKRHTREAVQAFTHALQIQPRYAPAVLNLGLIAVQNLNNKAYALQRFRDYLVLEPSSSNTAAVAELARQLELELQPKPVAVPAPAPTNAAAEPKSNAAPARFILPRTNAPRLTSGNPSMEPAHSTAARENLKTNALAEKPPITNAPPPAAAARPEPAPSRPTNSVVAKAEPLPPPEAKVETVQVKEEPIAVKVQDVPVKPALPVASNRVDPPAVATNPTAITPEAKSEPAPAPLIKPARREPKSGLLAKVSPVLDKMNPAGWFKGREKNTNAPAPKEELKTAAKAPAPVPRPIPATATPPAAAPAPGVDLSSLPHYRYVSPAPGKAGDPEQARALLDKGVEAHQGRRFEEAISLYQAALAKDPSSFEAAYNLAAAALQAKNLPLALLSSERALALQPESADARFNFAAALQNANYPLDAAVELERVLRNHPEHARAHLALANIYAQKLGQPAQARAHYQALLQLQPGHPFAEQIRAWLASH